MPHLRDAGAPTPRRPSRAGATLRWFQLEPPAVPDDAEPRRWRAEAAAERPAFTVAVEPPILNGERPIDRIEAERPAA